MKNKNSSKAGFTLLEILIAVLIIGVLTTIALPMYQGAVDKSKWARLIAPARAVSTAQEAAFMNYGGYTANIDDLDVSLPEGNDMTYTLYTTTNGDDANFIRITSTQLNDVRLAKYYKNNEGFEDQLYCEAKNGNDRANKLCGKLLKGQDLVDTNDGYRMYLIDDAINKPLCNRVSLWWSNNFTHCYKTEEERCTANTMPYGGGLCGWTSGNNHEINEGGTCDSDGGSRCNYSIINKDGECIGNHEATCTSSTINDGGKCIAQGFVACRYSTINDGGECIARPHEEGRAGNECADVTINNGGKCTVEEGSAGCNRAVINDGGICDGTFGGCTDATINDGGKCIAGTGTACQRSKVYDGGECVANGGSWPCYLVNVYSGGKCTGNASQGCLGTYHEGSVCDGMVADSCRGISRNGTSTFESGAVCNGHADGTCGGGSLTRFQSGATCNGYASGSCGGKFESGARCVAHVAGSCAGTYVEGSCCQGGDNCPANAPRC